MKFGRLQSASLTLFAAACFCSAALAQDAAKPKAAGSSDVSDALPDLLELDPFGGVSLFSQISRGLNEKYIDGGTAGGRVAYNFTRYLGLEFSYNFSENGIRLLTPVAPGLPSYNFLQQSHAASLDPVFNLRPRDKRIVPYVTAGFGFINWVPTKQATDFAKANNATYLSGNLRSDFEPAFNFGGGVKIHISPHFGLRFDLREIIEPKNPTFGLVNFPNGGIYIPNKSVQRGLDATVGLIFYFGRYTAPLPPCYPNCNPVPVGPITSTEITGGGGTLCQGKAISLHVTATDPANHTLKYVWKLNGAETTGGADFSFTPNSGGTNTVEVAIVDTMDATRSIKVGPRTITVQEYLKPQITSVTATPTALACASNDGVHTAALAGTATGSACGGNLTYKWTVSEGSVTNDSSPNATFDGSNLGFDSAVAQKKSITATLTVADETGATATQTTAITVDCKPNFIHVGDLIFAKNGARINNCAKRILIDQAAQQAGTTYDILLVAHRAADEKEILIPAKKGKNAAPATTLDTQRALNAAAVLANDTKTCGTVDLTQIKMDVEGTDQTGEHKPGICGTSNWPANEKGERKGSKVTEADQDRRVEVYLVPKGASAMPPAAKNAKPVPESVVKALGCPK